MEISDDAAERAGAAHRDEAVGPLTELDGLLSQLLALQDDLASVVSSLAAHWPVDLPTPELQGHRLDSERVTIEVQAETADNLTRIARLLGVEVGPDRLDGYVSAYQRFGAVCVSAWLPAQPWYSEATA